MKKSKYVTKYDYINYYTKQPQMWFFTNEEINKAYQLQYLNAKNKNNKKIKIDELDELDEDVDNYEEIDCYEIYREILFEKEDLNNKIDDPKLISGQIIDQKSKQAIKDFFENKFSNKKFFYFDFDNEKITLEDNFKKTIDLIQKNENIILFQPALINRVKMIATKCDAIIKIKDDNGNAVLYLVETKGTSTAKFHHVLDLLFQKKIIETIFTSKVVINYCLCLIKYEKLAKQNVSFIISDTINLSKTIFLPKNYDLQTKQKIKIGDEYLNKNFQKILPKKINEIFNFNKEYFRKLDNNSPKSNYLNKFEILQNLSLDFTKVIDELWQHKTNMEKQKKCTPGLFKPNKNDKSIFKVTDLWNELRKLYLLEGYSLFKYSGNVIDQGSDILDKIGKNDEFKDNVANFFKTSKNKHKICDYKFLFFDSTFDSQVNKDRFYNLMNKLKNKKVYFDFETINPAIRVVDDSLPFSQIVTQNSVIIDEDNNEPLICNNLMEDPLNYSDNFYKKVIDSIYRGSDYSYIVYNKSFEKSRLIEMAEHLDDNEYKNKVNIIVDNIFDLADFFKISQASGYVLFYKELGGYHSIKKILPLIEKYDPKIFEQAKCINYDELEIKNGQMCQQYSLLRFFGFYKQYVSEQKWQEIVENSKKYCENDVRAMIAIVNFLKKLHF